MPRSHYAAPPPPGLPQLTRWMTQVLVGLFALYFVEVLLAAIGAPTTALAWWPPGEGFAVWQPVTRFFVQGHTNVFGVLIGLVFVYLFLPAMDRTLPKRQLLEAIGWAAAASTVLPLALHLATMAGFTGLRPGPLLGWFGFFEAMVCLYGLARPDDVIYIFFVLPVRAGWLVWGSLAFSLLMLLSQISVSAPISHSLELVGMWIGAYAWWNVRGPGGRRRTLKHKAKTVERDLRRLRILPGGKDDTVH